MERDADGIAQKVHDNVAFRFAPDDHTLLDLRVPATREDFPAAPAKLPDLKRCAFASDITRRGDGQVDLYSGLGDTREGRIAIDNPFDMEWNEAL